MPTRSGARAFRNRPIQQAAVLVALVYAPSGCAAPGHPDAAPLTLSRWQPPAGQSCHVDQLSPPELPRVATLLDSAALARDIVGSGQLGSGSALLALKFDASGSPAQAIVLDRRLGAAAADSIATMVASSLRRQPPGDAWGARLLVSAGPSPVFSLSRREVCPPALDRIKPASTLRGSAASTADAEPDVVPSPDWVIRNVPPPPARPRLSVEKAAAGIGPRDTIPVAIDSAALEPDLGALGDSAIVLRVLIDRSGNIAYAEMHRSVAARTDRQRLAAELARYRFHPALEDRVPTDWWMLLKIR